MKRIKSKLLSKKDIKKVEVILKGGKDVREYRRALILKCLHQGYTQAAIAELGLAKERTIRDIVNRYKDGGLDSALIDRARPGQPRKISRRQEEKIAAIACTAPPEGQSRWTLDLIKEASEQNKIVKSISRESLRILLASREIKPWRHKMWCVPNLNDEFIKCMEDVLKLYEKPYDSKEPVVCLDEKPIQLLASKIPDIVGKTIKQDYEYKRNGVVNAFCAIEPRAGKHFVMIRERKTMKDFALFVRSIVNAYPKAKKIHLVMDNLGTHKKAALIKTFGKKVGKKLWRRIRPHYTPKHASWLNQAEIEIGMFTRGCIGKQRVSDKATLVQKARAWTKRMNRKKVKIDWTFSRRKARVKFNYKTGKN